MLKFLSALQVPSLCVSLVTCVGFPPSRIRSQNAALPSPYSLGSHFPLTASLFPNGFLGEKWILGRKWTQWSRLPVSSPNPSPAPTHHPPLLVQYPLCLKTSCAQIQSSIFVTQHSYKETSVQSWPPDFVYFFEETPNLLNKKNLRVPGLHFGKQTSIFVSFLRDVVPQ